MRYSKVNLIIIISVVIFVIGTVFLFIAYPDLFKTETVVSHEFVGTIKNIEGSYIYTEGTFYEAGEVGNNNKSRSSDLKNVKILIGPTTEIVIWSYVILPPVAGVSENNSEFDMDEKNGSIEDLSPGKGITVTVGEDMNIFNKSEFTASKILYVLPFPTK